MKPGNRITLGMAETTVNTEAGEAWTNGRLYTCLE
jgi:hypothetical protein